MVHHLTTCALLYLAAAGWGCSFKEEGAKAPARLSRSVSGEAVIDLSDEWTPFLFSKQACAGDNDSSPKGFRTTFIALANEQPVVSPLQKAAHSAFLRRLSVKRRREFQDKPVSPEIFRYLEVYGIPPTLSVLRERARSELEKPCWKDIRYDKLKAFSGVVAYANNRHARTQAALGKRFWDELQSDMSMRDIADFGTYLQSAPDEETRRRIAVALAYEALVEAQRLLRCEGLLTDAEAPAVNGGLDYQTHLALVAFEQKNRIVGWGNFGGETLAALAESPDDRLYETLVRVVTERVADGAGVIEDGTAVENGAPSTYIDVHGKTRAVPNLVDDFTRTILAQLGIQDKVAGIAFLVNASKDTFRNLKVPLRLTRLPPYYSSRMSLGMEIDRGDVYYDYPYENGIRKYQPKENAPALRVFVYHDGQKILLAKMDTSVGGWQDETADDGYVYLKYKNSAPGAGILREILAAPSWIPPESTPPAEILTTASTLGREVTVPDQNLIGPWFTSAYGPAAGVYLRQTEAPGESPSFADEGIRIHGSYDYTSVAKRNTHGCHRLYNYAALRLYDFILRRSPYRCLGEKAVREVRRFEHDGTDYKFEVNTEGTVFQLEKPIPVKTLDGRILGNAKSPIPFYMQKPGVRYGSDAVYVRP